MKLKQRLIPLAGLLLTTSLVQAAGTISGPGWYYQALPVGAIGNYTNIFLKGDYPDEASCQTARWNDYDPGDGIVPWDGGPGCHYIHDNDVQNANDLYSVAFNPGTDVILGLDAELQLMFFEQMDEINQAHDIQRYRQKVNRLIDSFRQKNQR